MPTSCIVKRGTDRKISSVSTKSGQRSALYDKIASIPLMENRERALSVFKLVYSSKFLKDFGDWTKNIPVNKEAYNAIKKNIKFVPEQYRDAVLKKAKGMDNPLLVSMTNTGYSMKEDGLSFYSTSLSEEVFLIDKMIPSSHDISEILPSEDPSVVRSEILTSDFSPVIDFIDSDGSSYIVVRDGLKVYSPSEIEANSDIVTGSTYLTGEPRLFFQTENGRLYDDYAQALKAGSVSIRAGFSSGSISAVSESGEIVPDTGSSLDYYQLNDSSSFIPVMTLPGTTNISSRNGMINYLIKKGFLSGSKIYDPETKTYYLTGAGYQGDVRLFNSANAYYQISNMIGASNVTMDENGFIRLKPYNPDKIDVISESKSASVSKKQLISDLKAGRYNELAAKYDHFDNLVLSFILEDNNIYQNGNKNLIADAKAEDLRQRTAILDILKTLGVRVVGMTDYIDKYKTKYGHEPSARALADIANNVIAVSENATMEDIAEETSHFLVEAYKDQQAVRDILPEVESSSEWNTYAGRYYDVYGKTLQGEELDEAVRREILGKIIANNFKASFTEEGGTVDQQTGFWTRLGNLIRGMIQSVSSMINTQKTDLNRIVDDITKSAIADNPSVFDTSLLKDNTFTLYSLESKDRNKFLQNRVSELKKVFRNLRRISTNRDIRERYKKEGDRKIGTNLEVSVSRSLNQLRDIEKRLNDTEASIEKSEMISSFNSIISTAEANVNYIKNLIKSSMKEDGSGKLTLDSSDRLNIEVITKEILPILKELRAFSRNTNEFDPDVVNSFVNRIDKAVSDIAGMKSDIDYVVESDKHTFVTSLLDLFNVPKDSDLRSKMFEIYDGVQKDVGFLARWFGILENSSNMMLNTLGGLIAKNNYEANLKTQAAVNVFLKDVIANGWNKAKYENLLQKVDDKTSRYLKSAIDMAKFDQDYKIAQMKAFREVIDSIDLTDEQIEDIVKNDKKYYLPGTQTRIKPSIDRVNLDILTVEQEQKYSDLMRKWLKNNTEQPFKISYEERLNDVYNEANTKYDRKITQQTKEFLENISRQKYVLKSPFYDNEGRFDELGWIRSSNFVEFANLQKQQKEAASEYIYTGGTSASIDFRDEELENEVIYNGGLTKKEGIDLEIAKDLQVINKVYAERYKTESKTRLTSEALFSRIREVQSGDGGASEAFAYTTAAGHLAFNDKFWEEIGNNMSGSTSSGNIPSYRQLANEIIKGQDDLDFVEEINNIVLLINESKKHIKNIISFNRDTSNPGEINYPSFTAGELETIKTLSETIESQYMNLMSHAQNYGIDYRQYLRPSTSAENEVNEAYKNALKDSGMEEYAFCMKHTTAKKADKISDFAAKIKASIDNRKIFTPGETAFLAEELGLNPKLPKVTFRNEANRIIASTPNLRFEIAGKFAQRSVFSYFKKMAPEGYSQFMSDIKSDKIDIATLVKDLQEGTSSQNYAIDISYLKFNANRQWLETDTEEESDKNPNYRKNHGYGRYQPSKDKYTDQSYINDYGIIFNSDGTEKATKNIDEWKMIQNLKEISKKAFETYGERNRNIYSIPQMSKSGLEKIHQFGSEPGKVIKNYIADIALDRIDDSLYGRTDNDENVDVIDRPRAIPKYFLNELEEQSDVSHDLTYSYSMLMRQAALFEERNKTLEYAMGLEQMLLNSQFNDGKRPDSTHTYETFKDFLNANFFGVRMNTKKLNVTVAGYKFDVAKIMMNAERAMSIMNLSMSPAVALTGALTGQINYFIESAVGQYIDKSSIVYAEKELIRHMPSYISEIGDLDRKSKLYVIGERLGLFDIQNRVYGAGYNKMVRTLTRDVNFKMMEIATSTLDPKVMISVLDNMRYYKGRFYTFREYKSQREKDREPEHIKREWEELREKSLWNTIDVKDGNFMIKTESGIPVEDVEVAMRLARNQAKSLAQIVNGSLNEENRIGATRNWMARFTTAHRGWLTLAAQRLWKRKGFNFQTMQMEEGVTNSLINMLKKLFTLTSEKGIGDIAETWKQFRSEMSEEEKINSRRLAVYASTYLLMQALAAITFGWRDDDDEKDNWFTQFSSYILMRTINEISSQMPIFMESNVVDIITDPFVMARKFKDFSNLDNYSLDEVTSGSYAGESKLFRLFAKQSFIKQWYSMKTVEDVRRTSDWWLQTNRQSMMFFWGATRDKNGDTEDTRDDVTFK